MRRPTRENPGQLLLAGWLFADLLLALVIIMLGSMVGPSATAGTETTPSPTPSPTSTLALASPSPNASPSPTPTASELPGISQKPQVLEFAVNTAALRSSASARAELGRRIRDATQEFNGKRAGIVLIWGYDPSLGIGVSTAETVKPLLRKWRPLMFSDAATRQLGNTGGSNKVKLDIYYFK